MPKDKLTSYSSTAGSNTDIGGINIDEGMLPSNVNNALREQMSHLADFAAGTSGVDVLKFQDDTDTNSIKIQAPASVTATTTFTLPDGDGSANQSLVTNGSGTLSFSTRLANVVEDTTPQLGGDLDVNGNSIVSVSNGDINITPNGTGNVSLGNFTFDADQTVGAGQDNYLMTYDNASGTISLEAAPAGGAGYFQGENGATGDTTNGKGDIFRVHEQQLDTNTTIASGDNAGCFFNLTVASGVTLTVNGNLVIA